MAGPNDIIGFDEYCKEPTCQWHIVALRTKTATANPQPHARCPQDHPAGVVAIPIRGTTPLPDDAGPVHEVVILPAKPYGGFILQVDDDDAAPKWEGGVAAPAVAKPPSDPQHTGARYVAELQRDLIQLGYLSEARWERPGGPQPWTVFQKGKFTMPVAAAVLTLKADLARGSPAGYGVATKPFLQAKGEAASADKSSLTPDVNAPFPVFFDPKLRNPRTIAINWNDWTKFLQAEDGVKKAWDGLKAHIVYPAKVKISYALPADPGGQASSNSIDAGTIDEESAALGTLQGELDGFKGSATGAARKQAITRALAALDARKAKIERVKTDIGAFATRMQSAVNELGSESDKILALVAPLDTKTVVTRSTIDWKLDSDRNDTQKKVLDKIKSDFDVIKKAAHADAGSPDGKLAKIAAVCDDVVATIKGQPSLAAAVDPAVQTVGTDAHVARNKLGALVTAIDGVDFDTAMKQYRLDVREFSRVDPATAYCIKKMVAERKLNGRNAFVAPEESEIIEWNATVTLQDGSTRTQKIGLKALSNDPPLCVALLKQAATEVLPSLAPMFPKTAFPILHAMLFNESGWVQYGGNFEGFKYITMGIDWRNIVTPEGTPLRAFLFDEFTTVVPGYAFNRGWGLSQNSPGTTGDFNRSLGFGKRVVGAASEDHSGEHVSFQFFDALPMPVTDEQAWPATLVSPKAALAFAMNLVINNFHETVKKVACTFPSADKPSFDCAKCLARFTPGEFIDTEQLKKRFPFESGIADQAKEKFLADKKPKNDEERAKLLQSPECQKAIDDAYAAQNQADKDAAKAEAEAQLEARKKKGEKNVPTIDDFMKTPEFQAMVEKQRAKAEEKFKPEKGATPPLPEVTAKQITSAVTPAAFERVFGKRPQQAFDCVEQPCSWLAARAFYAGRVPEGITHAGEVARDVVRLNK